MSSREGWRAANGMKKKKKKKKKLQFQKKLQFLYFIDFHKKYVSSWPLRGSAPRGFIYIALPPPRRAFFGSASFLAAVLRRCRPLRACLRAPDRARVSLVSPARTLRPRLPEVEGPLLWLRRLRPHREVVPYAPGTPSTSAPRGLLCVPLAESVVFVAWSLVGSVLATSRRTGHRCSRKP